MSLRGFHEAMGSARAFLEGTADDSAWVAVGEPREPGKVPGLSCPGPRWSREPRQGAGLAGGEGSVKGPPLPGGARRRALPPSAARGRDGPRSSPPCWSRRLTSSGPAGAAGHKGSFVGRRRDKAARAGVGASEAGRAGPAGGHRRGPGTWDPASAHLPIPSRPPGPRVLAGDERLWPPPSEGVQRPPSSSPVPRAFPAALSLRAREHQLTRRTESHAQAWIPSCLQQSALDPAEPQMRGWGAVRAPVP